ncbi:cytochrome P460 family protein [Paraferrimonas sedimenticola]|nr:cytochrome P460 family protein [Paraferrimonas sedimenticola]
MKLLQGFCWIFTAALAMRVSAEPNLQQTFSTWVNANGELRLPTNLQRGWLHLGSSALMAADGTRIESIHSVYTQADAADYYRKHGKFADGTVLIKEIRFANMNDLVTGALASADAVDVWFMMVKDTRDRFKGKRDWGKSWGWALFGSNDPTTNVSAGYEQECLGCHVPAKRSDYVYTKLYPGLRPGP